MVPFSSLSYRAGNRLVKTGLTHFLLHLVVLSLRVYCPIVYQRRNEHSAQISDLNKRIWVNYLIYAQRRVFLLCIFLDFGLSL